MHTVARMRTHGQWKIFELLPMYFRTNDTDQLGIGVWSMKPTTKLASKYADLRPTGNGKGICRTYHKI